MTDIPRELRTRRAKQLFDAADAKPPYRVPSMAEIAEIPWNGLTVVSTFAGGGGSSLGYRMAGFRVLWASEFVPAAQDTYRANMAPGTILDGRDVRDVTAAEVLEACGLDAGELDVLDGSPPCQAFSTVGKREKGWGQEREYAHGAKQKNEELFYEFVRLRDGLMPRSFVAENVSGLVKGAAKGFFLDILARLKVGYRVEARVLDAQWLGVPQQRQRVIFVGVREDLGLGPAFPSPLPWRYSVRDALPWLGGDVAKNKNAAFSGKGARFDGDEASPTVMSRRVNLEVQERLVQGEEVDFKNKGRPIDVEAPMPAVAAGDPGRRTPRQFAVERVVHDPGRPNVPPVDVTDEPCRAITGGNLAKGGGPTSHFQVVHRKQFTHEMVDITDQPAPTVTSGGKAPNASHFQVEFRGGPGGQPRGRKSSEVDEVAHTISAGGYGAAAINQTHLVEVRKFMNRDSVAENVAPTLDGYAVGREYDKLNPGQSSDKFFNLVRPDASKPCPTITSQGSGGVASVCHPTERRKFTILELKRICAFPDDFVLTGTYAQQWERLGNSVPPLMIRHVAEALRDRVLLPALERGRSKATRRAADIRRAASPPASKDAGASRAGRSRRRAPRVPSDGA